MLLSPVIFFFKILFLAFLLLSLQIVGFLLVFLAMEFMFVLVVSLRRFQILFYGLHVFHIICLAAVAHHLFLLQVPISSCSVEVLVRGCKCKRAIQTATVWLVGFSPLELDDDDERVELRHTDGCIQFY